MSGAAQHWPGRPPAGPASPASLGDVLPEASPGGVDDDRLLLPLAHDPDPALPGWGLDRLPFFYGWVIVVACVVTKIAKVCSTPWYPVKDP